MSRMPPRLLKLHFLLPGREREAGPLCLTTAHQRNTMYHSPRARRKPYHAPGARPALTRRQVNYRREAAAEILFVLGLLIVIFILANGLSN